MAISGDEPFGVGWQPGLDSQDLIDAQEAERDEGAIIEEVPARRHGLGWYSVGCLLLNRMIGSGVFNSSSVIYVNTRSIRDAILFWVYGAVIALTGVVVYIELGLSIPRWRLANNTTIPTPRSGGELTMLNFFLKRPRFLATCIFGMSFIVFGNTATNSVAGAKEMLHASNTDLTASKVAGLAIAVNTFSCLLHSMSRTWGIRLNNLLGTLKLAMVLLLIIVGFVFLDRTVAKDNFSQAFVSDQPRSVYKYAEAALFALFPFGGFHQANYVLAEIDRPRTTFTRATGGCVVLICCLFVTLNTLFAALVPYPKLFGQNADVKADVDVGLEFFSHTLGKVTTGKAQTASIFSSFKALSAIGNVIVFTFTAARVKQEIAKEGIFGPMSLFFASNYEFSFRRFFRRLPDEPGHGANLHTEKAPAAALGLHWTVTSILILGVVFGTGHSSPFDPKPAYTFLLAAYAYVIDVIWFSCVGLGHLYLCLFMKADIRASSPFPRALSLVAAAIFTAANLFPLIVIWVPDWSAPFLARTDGKIPWYSGPTFALSVLAASGIYWLGFRFYLHQRWVRRGLRWVVDRKPTFLDVQGQLVQFYETVRLQWKYEEAPGSSYEMN